MDLSFYFNSKMGLDKWSRIKELAENERKNQLVHVVRHAGWTKTQETMVLPRALFENDFGLASALWNQKVLDNTNTKAHGCYQHPKNKSICHWRMPNVRQEFASSKTLKIVTPKENERQSRQLKVSLNQILKQRCFPQYAAKSAPDSTFVNIFDYCTNSGVPSRLLADDQELLAAVDLEIALLRGATATSLTSAFESHFKNVFGDALYLPHSALLVRRIFKLGHSAQIIKQDLARGVARMALKYKDLDVKMRLGEFRPQGQQDVARAIKREIDQMIFLVESASSK